MKYYCVKQHDVTDCGAACVATVARQYGRDTSIARIREVCGTDKQGTNVYGMMKAATQLGFTVKGVKGDQAAFFSEFPLPAIAHVVHNENLLHYVVVHKITPKQVVVADPAKGLMKYTPDEFFKVWTGVLIILTPNESFTKGCDKKHTMASFLRLLVPQKKLIFNIFLTSLIITFLGILSSFYFKLIMDDIVRNSLHNTLTAVSVGMILLYLVKTVMELFRNQLMLYLSQKLDIPIILGYHQHVMGLPMSFFESRRTGEIISRFVDASKIREAISGATLTIMIDTIMAVIGGVVLYMLSPMLFAISAAMLLLYGVVVFCYNKPVKKANQQVMEQNAKVTAYLVESLNGIETIKAFNAEQMANYRTEKLFVKFLKSVFHNSSLINIQHSITNGIALVGEIVILWVGTTQVLRGGMTIGQLITFNALLAYFLTPIKNLINLQPTMQTAIVAAERLGEILELSLEKDENEDKRIQDISLRQPITISELKFRYGSHRLTLDDISMSISPGEKIALVGESGSGKTTLVKLLMRFYSWESGEIYFGSHNIKDISLGALRSKIAYISQDIFLFNGTIRENLTFGRNDISLEQIIEACKLSKADEFINKLPMRYETELEENGANLSGGQKQRLAIARALLQKPDVLIMDEATSNLDSITERAIERTIGDLSKDVTTIIIAHRLSTITRCDKIYVLADGKVVESGSHDNLLAEKGQYYSLWKEQALTQVEVNQP